MQIMVNLDPPPPPPLQALVLVFLIGTSTISGQAGHTYQIKLKL